MTDCDDGEITIYPGAPEVLNNGIDENCDDSDETALNSLNVDFEKTPAAPNPFDNHVKIVLPPQFNNSYLRVRIFELSGRLVIEKKYSILNNEIDITNLDKLNPGPYIFEIMEMNEGSTIYKTLISRK